MVLEFLYEVFCVCWSLTTLSAKIIGLTILGDFFRLCKSCFQTPSQHYWLFLSKARDFQQGIFQGVHPALLPLFCYLRGGKTTPNCVENREDSEISA